MLIRSGVKYEKGGILHIQFGRRVYLRLWLRRCCFQVGWHVWYFPPLPRSWWDDEVDHLKEIGWKGYGK